MPYIIKQQNLINFRVYNFNNNEIKLGVWGLGFGVWAFAKDACGDVGDAFDDASDRVSGLGGRTTQRAEKTELFSKILSLFLYINSLRNVSFTRKYFNNGFRIILYKIVLIFNMSILLDLIAMEYSSFIIMLKL